MSKEENQDKAPTGLEVLQTENNKLKEENKQLKDDLASHTNTIKELMVKVLSTLKYHQII